MTYDQGKDQFKYHSDKEQQTRKIIESKVDKVREKSSAGGAGVMAYGFGVSAWGSSGSKEGDSKSSKTNNYK
uniref:Uncharacterized protein n=1 Tax=Acrobeloides nanus TaxID=290746 RepID=A0A914DNB5_9BILA